jgi:uncharacterized membrane protein
LVIREIYRPELDLLRCKGQVDDPSGGVFEHAPDAPPKWLPDWLRPQSDRTRVSPAPEPEPELAEAK